MQKKVFLFIALTLALGGVLLVATGYDKNVSPRSHTGTASPFDHSVKVEYGKPITVRRVIDGDTIELINGERLRYIGIDTPEEVAPRKPVQCFARAAAAKNKELVEGKVISFYKDVSTRDQYGRWLGFVYLADGTFVNLELVKQGFAFSYSYPPDISKADLFRAAETQARESNLGLWAGCTVSHTGSGRSQTNSVGENP